MAENLSAYVFVDGGYLRAELDKIRVAWKNLNVSPLATAATEYVGGEWQERRMLIARVFIYDAVGPEDSGSQADVRQWLERNAKSLDLHVRRGALVGTPPRQKGVDVELAVGALTFASSGVCDVAVFLTGDGDFAPLAQAVRDKGPLVAVCCFRSNLSPALKEAADRVGYLPDDPGI